MQATQERSVFSPQGVSLFSIQQLVLVHLPDDQRDSVLIPVPGVVVRPGIEKSIVRIRSRSTGQIVDIQVSTNDLVAR